MTISLCMIVKDEAHIIRRCLTRALPLVDHVLVVDTGSTDGTQQVVRDFLKEHELPGLVIEEPWRDFAYNRSFAIARLREVEGIDYGLMTDADNVLHFDEGFDAAAFKAGLHHDYYQVTIRHEPASYSLPWLFSTRYPFRFQGVLHEFMDIPPGLTGGIARGFHSEQIQDSARNRNPHKYLADALVLENALTREQDPGMVARYTFYLAQSYRDADIPQRALDCYLRAADLVQWQEERYVCLWQAAHLKRRLGHDADEVLRAYMRAQNAQPARAEALYGAASFCREKKRHALGVQLAEAGLRIPKPDPAHGLFVEGWIHEYGLLDEFAVNAYWVGRHAESRDACLKILENPHLPASERPRILANLAFAREKADASASTFPNVTPGPSPAPDLTAMLAPARITHIVDIGANPIDGHPPYRPMLLDGQCHVTGFEPQPEALAQLRASQSPLESYLPYAVGDGGEHLLHVCEASGMTSTLEPDPTLLKLFEPFASFGTVTATVPLATRRLDDIAEIEHMDLLKIDIQGGELEVFRHGTEKLSQTVAIQVEVSFVPLYRNQPGIGEIDVELRRQGFIPHGFAAVKNWPLAPWPAGASVTPGMSQLLEADLVYVRDFTRPDGLDSEALKHLALIAHHCYRSYALALHCIDLLEQRAAVQAGSREAYQRLIGIHHKGEPRNPESI